MANIGRENEFIEFKESTSEFEKACKAIVGMLNKAGYGTVYFGVKDSGEIIGQMVGKDTLSNLTDRIKYSIKPSIYPIIEKINIDNKDIIKVTFKGNNKPYAYKGAFYIRVEQQNLLVDPLVLREMIKTSHEFNDSWEKELTRYGIEAVDEQSLDMFYRQAVAMGRINKYEHTPSELLVQLGLMEDDRLTNAGYYLFGKNVSLVYKAVEYSTTERLNPIDLKRFEGNIFILINDVMNFINNKMRWAVKIDGIQRTEIPEVPVVAIREIVINSLVHSDFYGDSEHQVTFDPSVIEIYNPGDFGEFTPDDYINDTLPSRTRHKIIQNILYKAFDIEALGRGLKRMDVLCREAHVSWDYRKFSFGFVFKFLRNNDKDNTKITSLSAKKILDYMIKNDGLLESIEEAMKVINKKERQTCTYINELIESGKIERIGSKKSGFWRLVR